MALTHDRNLLGVFFDPEVTDLRTVLLTIRCYSRLMSSDMYVGQARLLFLNRAHKD